MTNILRKITLGLAAVIALGAVGATVPANAELYSGCSAGADRVRKC